MVEWAYLGAGVGPMALVVIVGLWGDRLVNSFVENSNGWSARHAALSARCHWSWELIPQRFTGLLPALCPKVPLFSV